MNFQLSVKEILRETYILTGKINNEQLIKNLINAVRKNKDENLSYKTHIKGHFSGFKSLIHDNDFWTFLKIIQDNIKIIWRNNFQISDAWGNICNTGGEVTEHTHEGVDAFCGILYLTEGGPGTYFKEHDLLVKEEIGKYVLFHPSLHHSVKKIENNIERITIAFNMNEVKTWENYSQATWVNKK